MSDTVVNIKGRDFASATGSAGPVNFSAVNLGPGAGVLSSSGAGGGSPFPLIALAVLAIAALFLLE